MHICMILLQAEVSYNDPGEFTSYKLNLVWLLDEGVSEIQQILSHQFIMTSQ